MCARTGGEYGLMETILMTGDIVLDCHLYGGVKTAAASFSGPGAAYTEHLGGAALTHELVGAAASAAAAADGPAYATHLGLDTKGLDKSLPAHLRSYGVWVDTPAGKGSK